MGKLWVAISHALGNCKSLPLKGKAKHQKKKKKKNDQMPLDCFSYASFKVISIVCRVYFILFFGPGSEPSFLMLGSGRI